MSTKNRTGWSRDGPRCLQDAPRPQDSPKKAKTAQDGTKTARKGPNSPKMAKTAQDGTKMARKGPKMLRWPKNAGAKMLFMYVPFLLRTREVSYTTLNTYSKNPADSRIPGGSSKPHREQQKRNRGDKGVPGHTEKTQGESREVQSHSSSSSKYICSGHELRTFNPTGVVGVNVLSRQKWLAAKTAAFYVVSIVYAALLL